MDVLYHIKTIHPSILIKDRFLGEFISNGGSCVVIAAKPISIKL